jgi:hydrogenase maturation protease
MTTPRVLIIAYGNPLRGDDGLAWHVAEKLSEMNLPGDIEIITRHLLTPELALPVSQATTVFFIDAARDGVPGELASGLIEPQRSCSVFTHELSPGAVLTAAQELYGRCVEAFSISLCGECFDHGETLSAKVEEGLPHLVALIGEFIQSTKQSQTTCLAAPIGLRNP